MERRSILLVEDHGIVAEATRQLLEQKAQFDLTICGSAAEAVAAAKMPGNWFRVFLDLEVPGAQGLSLVRDFVELGYRERTCVVTGFASASLVAEVRALGMLGYILKAMSAAQFSAALDAVLRGIPTFPPEVPTSGRTLVRLTKRQQELLECIERGWPSKKIADHMGIAEGTVNNQISGLFRVLGVNNRPQALTRGFELGLIRLAPASVVT